LNQETGYKISGMILPFFKWGSQHHNWKILFHQMLNLVMGISLRTVYIVFVL
jgi:hypothetical protein